MHGIYRSKVGLCCIFQVQASAVGLLSAGSLEMASGERWFVSFYPRMKVGDTKDSVRSRPHRRRCRDFLLDAIS